MRKTYWAGLTRIVSTKLWRRICARLVRVILVEPERPASSLAAATAVLQSRGSLIWFPEGKVSPTGELQAFKPGIGLLLEHIDVPVVPVYIEGANRALPLGEWRIHLHPIQIRIGKPLSRDSLIRLGEGVRTRDRIANAVHDEVKKLE